MAEFVSEPITPWPGTFDAQAMSRGEPGLPAGFERHGQPCHIVGCLSRWKQSAPEGGKPGGELYLRRHYFKLEMDNSEIWTVYFLRQPMRSTSARRRWFLYATEPLPDK